MSEARDEIIAALVAQVIILVVGLGVCYGPEPSTVEGVPLAASAQGVPEPL